MITKMLRNISLALIFIIPFIPLYVANSMFFPFITGKAFAFRIIVEIIFALWIALMLYDKRYAPKFSWLSLAVTFFMIVALITDLLGMNPLRSIWSNFERMEGWVMIVHLWAYFMAVTGIFGTGEEGRRIWHNFFKTTLFAASIVGIYGLFQIFGTAAIHQGSSRIDASLGNSAYMAVYMLIHTFIALYMSRDSRWYFALSAFFTFLLFETATRGTILGLIGGVMLSLVIYAAFGKKQSKKSRWVSGGIVVGIILLGVLFYINKDLSFIQKNETLRRLSEISLNDTRTQARGYIWPMAIKGVFETPKTTIIGVGQENFNYIFNANYNPKMWMHEQWFDRAHSVFIDWLVAGGLLGFISYLSLFILAIVSLWKSTNLTFRDKTIFTGLLVGYAVHNIFVFDNIASYMLFFTVLAFIHSIKAEKSIKWLEISDDQSENKMVVRDYIFIPVIAILFVTTLYFVNVRPIQANIRLIAALNSCSGGGNLSAGNYAKALELDQYMANQEIREQLLACAAKVAGSDFPKQMKDEFYVLSKQEINEQIKNTPNDARSYILGGAYYNNIGDWESGRPLLEKANQLSPNKQSIIMELATNYMNSKREKEALALVEKAYESAPDNDTSKIGYLALLLLNKEDQKAKELFGNQPELFMDPRIIGIYVRLKNFPPVIEAYKALVKKDPSNLQNYGSLAAAYLANDQRTEAITVLREMEVKFPQVKAQIQEVIKEIQAGRNPL